MASSKSAGNSNKTDNKNPGDSEATRKVDEYLTKHAQWQHILQPVRELLLGTELTEAVKWGAPAYLLDGKIVVTLAAFKQHCAIWFHQGALLSDKSNKLINAQEGKTKDMRHWRFAIDDKPNKRLIKSYISEAIKNQRAINKDKTVKKGTTGKPQTRKLNIPDELNAALKKDKKLAAAFKALTPGRQREYAGHVADAKQEKTRLSRTAKITPMILAGVGLHDKYRNC